MALMFVSNNLADFGGNFVSSTTAGKHRSSRVSSSVITHGNFGTHETGLVSFAPVSGNVTYIHAQVALSGGAPTPNNSSADGELYCDVFDGNGNRILGFDVLNGDVVLNVFGATTGSQTRDNWIHGGQDIQALDIMIDLSGGDINVKAWTGAVDSDAVPDWDITVANTGTVKIAPIKVEWRVWRISNQLESFWQHISEMIVADEDTRGWGLTDLITYGAGDHSDWNGDVTTLTDQDNETGINTQTIGDKVSRKIATYTGPASSSIRAVVLATRVSAQGITGDVRQLLRSGTTDYPGANLGASSSLGYDLTEWVDNPETSVPWDTADLTDFNFGLEAVT